ncbi:MAG: hypothetical protein CBC83_02225 [Flavobacteriales bacterium TMED123]|nr:hypothetical protein [Candidatus Neomarinimicrobiota bacterium]MAJ44497.1 hypothetical protein [Candidatus Neomarinimicrobiota bacterium]OUV73935.1 MAG: hypothetical protein CBC83_04670 [Flavobacteriales bacterium TMED123]OUV75576.1 MAG: hypothetical protein CBC83_02225 [Flavobacteriales bacterium TMED123]|tara:strand:- start:3383 stop:3700 length:318 start_codon:yes stop_codon:yes gene_type:complete
MREYINDSWNVVMNVKYNPLRNVHDTQARHLIMQILAWMWCIVFSFFMGSYIIFGLTAIAHIILLAAIAITVSTFDTANRNPHILYNVAKRIDGYNGRRVTGEHD